MFKKVNRREFLGATLAAGLSSKAFALPGDKFLGHQHAYVHPVDAYLLDTLHASLTK